MMKAGLIEEMMTDAMDDVTETQEEEIDVEVDKVLQEVAGEVLAKLPEAGRTKLAPEPVKTEAVRCSFVGGKLSARLTASSLIL